MSQLSKPFSLDLVQDDLVKGVVQDQFSTQNSASNQSQTASISTAATSDGNNFGASQDFTFLINIIKNLEKTIEAQNRRIEGYENENQTQNVTITLIEQHIKTVHENQNVQKDAGESEEKNDGR